MKRPRTWPILLGLAVACAVTSLAYGAGEEPVVIGRHQAPPLLTLDPFSGSFGFLMIGQNDTSRSGNSTSRSTDAVFQEQLSLSTGGGIVTRNLFDWHAAATVGLNQEYDASNVDHRTTYGWLDAYDFQGTLLRTSDLPISLFARQGENYITRSFEPTLKDTSSSYGATVNWRSAIPTTLTVSHSDLTEAQLDGTPVYRLHQNDVSLNSEWNPTDQHRLSLSYDFSQVADNDGGINGSNYLTQNVSFMHQWALDHRFLSTLTQTLNYNSQTGDFPLDHLRIGEQLRLHLTDTLDGNLNYAYDDQKYRNVESRTHQFSAGLTHQLFESLTTTAQVGGSLADQTFGSGGGSNNSSYFGNVNVNYHKRIPYGLLNLNAGLGFTHADNGDTSQTPVFDTGTFTDPAPIILTRTGIDTNSLVVQSAAGNRTFKNGIDYTVHQIGNTVQIMRVVGGNIEDDQTVRVNYDLAPLPGYTSQTTNLNLGARYDITDGPLTGLGFFARYSQQDQNIDSTRPSALLADNIRDAIAGADYRFWHISLHAEDEHRESTLTPMDAQRFSARYTERLAKDTPLSIGFNQAFIHYPNYGDTNYTSLDARLEHSLNANWKAILAARWRKDDDSRFGNTMGFEEEAQLRYTLRQTQVYFALRHSFLEASSNEAQNITFQLGLTRNF